MTHDRPAVQAREKNASLESLGKDFAQEARKVAYLRGMPLLPGKVGPESGRHEEVMNAGRELDFLIAEKILEMPCECPHGPMMMCRVHDCALYSRDMGAAWVVVEKLGEDFRGLQRLNGGWNAITPSAHGWGETPALAICVAALSHTDAIRKAGTL